MKIQQITSLFRKGCIFRLPILPPIKIRKQNIHKREYEISHDHPGIQRHPLFHTLKYWQEYGREIMGDNPIAWNAMKERRKEEKQRRAIAEAKKQAEKFSTENLTELPLQVDFPVQENKEEWNNIIDRYVRENIWTFERVRKCATREHYDALGEAEQA